MVRFSFTEDDKIALCVGMTRWSDQVPVLKGGEQIANLIDVHRVRGKISQPLIRENLVFEKITGVGQIIPMEYCRRRKGFPKEINFWVIRLTRIARFPSLFLPYKTDFSLTRVVNANSTIPLFASFVGSCPSENHIHSTSWKSTCMVGVVLPLRLVCFGCLSSDVESIFFNFRVVIGKGSY